MRRKQIDVEFVKKTFRINNGFLERNDRRCKKDKWVTIENKINDNHGYCCVTTKERSVGYHRIIWILCYGEDVPVGFEIDHINGNKIDNRIENLRIVSPRENQQNRKRHRDGNLCGQHYDSFSKSYKTEIYINGTYVTIGRFKTKEEAHIAYRIACDNILRYVDNKSFRELVKKKL